MVNLKNRENAYIFFFSNPNYAFSQITPDLLILMELAGKMINPYPNTSNFRFKVCISDKLLMGRA